MAFTMPCWHGGQDSVDADQAITQCILTIARDDRQPDRRQCGVDAEYNMAIRK